MANKVIKVNPEAIEEENKKEEAEMNNEEKEVVATEPKNDDVRVMIVPQKKRGGIRETWNEASTLKKAGMVLGGAALLGVVGFGIYKAVEFFGADGDVTEVIDGADVVATIE